MLEHWLQPIKTKEIIPQDLEKWQLGQRVLYHTEGVVPDLTKIQIALIGIGSDADVVRRELYRLSCPFENVAIADVGNVRKEDISFIIPLLSELLEGRIVPVLLGHSEVFTLAQYQAYHQRRGMISVNIIDEKIRLTPSVQADNFFLHTILTDNRLFNCSVLGFQAHFTDPKAMDVFQQRHFEIVRLGKVKSAIEEAEPVIRDADMVSFNIAALKSSEAPAQMQSSPTGLTIEEACQLTRYAGLSDKLTSFGIYGFNKKYDIQNQTAQSIALMIWYFLDGFAQRKADFPISKAFNHLTQYIVDIKSFDYQITFWRSTKSGRWWMEVPVKVSKKQERHRLIPCSYNDYLQACQEDFPDRLVFAQKRFR